MKLWADACLTPALQTSHTPEATKARPNRQRGMLTALDAHLYPVVIDEDWVFITNDEHDFRKLAEREGLHSGMMSCLRPGRLPAGLGNAVVDFIEQHAGHEAEEPWEWMVCRVDRRVAALSGPAWMALLRRLVHFNTRMSIPLPQLALQEAHQHPDYERLADEFSAGEEGRG